MCLCSLLDSRCSVDVLLAASDASLSAGSVIIHVNKMAYICFNEDSVKYLSHWFTQYK